MVIRRVTIQSAIGGTKKFIKSELKTYWRSKIPFTILSFATDTFTKNVLISFLIKTMINFNLFYYHFVIDSK